MSEPPASQNPLAAENERFFDKTERAFRDLFDRARAKSEIHFVFSLAYAHADYVIWMDGLRLRKRNGGFPRKVPWSEFQARFERGIDVFRPLTETVNEYVASYNPARQFRGRRADNEPELLWTVHFDPEQRTFSISCGLG